MTGLDKIIKQIAEEASSVAQQKIKAAEVEAKILQMRRGKKQRNRQRLF